MGELFIMKKPPISDGNPETTRPMTPEFDAALFRALCDRLFHRIFFNADGSIGHDGTAREIFDTLSAHTYRHGKQGPMDARALVGENVEIAGRLLLREFNYPGE